MQKINDQKLFAVKEKKYCWYKWQKKENNKNVSIGNFSFHWLEIEQIENILIEISNFEFNIEKRV